MKLMFCLLCAIGCCTAYNTSFLRIDRTKSFRRADLTLYVTHPPSLPPSQTLSYLVGSTTQASSFLTTLPSSISSNTLVNNLNFESPNLATSSFTLAKTGDVLVAPTAEEIVRCVRSEGRGVRGEGGERGEGRGARGEDGATIST